MFTHFEVFATAKSKALPAEPYPNWTAIGFVNLADPALLLEMKAIAKLP